MRGEVGFMLRLAAHLRLTLREVFALSAMEYALWLAAFEERGFDVDRLEFVAAQAGSAAARGLKVKPIELVMPAAPDPQEKRRRVFDWLYSLKREQEAKSHVE